MLNMGGPSSLHGPRDGVKAFLTNLFSDPEIIPLGPLQKFLVRLLSAVFHTHRYRFRYLAWFASRDRTFPSEDLLKS